MALFFRLHLARMLAFAAACIFQFGFQDVGFYPVQFEAQIMFS
jgi:hypothetical protein